MQRSIVRSLLELVMSHPEFSRLVERSVLEPASGVAAINQAELKALAALLEAAARGETVVNWPEYFRDSEHEELLRQIEPGLLKRQEDNWSADEARAEFSDGWAQLQEMIRRGLLTALNEKAGKQELSSEDKDRYRRVTQSAQVVAQK